MYKPGELIRHLSERGYAVTLHEPPALTRAQLSLTHHPDYVDDILECREHNGFSDRDPEIARTLPYTSGSMVLAATLAFEHGIAASFSSGFHHAHFQRAGGFCTFNGLVVTSQLLHRDRGVNRMLILDLDYHYGDGTAELLEHHQIAYVRHETGGAHFRHPLDSQRYLDFVERVMSSLAQDPVDLILYQAGADVHVDDPLGGLLTTEQMATRDRLVFEAARRLGVPIAWNLAGGYQRDEQNGIGPVLRLHEQTYRIAQEIYGLAKVNL
jgi:acetoin utilization deacetylase AcuC-like enzyme